MDRPRQIFFLAPVSDDVGPTSMALGLVEALRRDHVDRDQQASMRQLTMAAAGLMLLVCRLANQFT